jgi:hypothetical protein
VTHNDTQSCKNIFRKELQILTLFFTLPDTNKAFSIAQFLLVAAIENENLEHCLIVALFQMMVLIL